MKRKNICILLVCCLLLFTGCREPVPPQVNLSATEPSITAVEPTAGTTETTTAATEPDETQATEAATTPTEPQAAEPTKAPTQPTAPTEPSKPEQAIPEPTEPAPTEPTPTVTVPLEPPTEETVPPTTIPPITEPVHQHCYTKETVAPTCEREGYTQYICSCGYSYRDSFTSMVAHDMKETDRKAATTSEEGYIRYTCSGCGKIETMVLEKEVLDLRDLEEYGRRYAAEEDGYEICVGLRDGYYPGVLVKITSLEEGRKWTAAAVDSQTNQLEARGLQIVKEMEDGTLGRARFDIEIVHEHGDYYRIWTYYG